MFKFKKNKPSDNKLENSSGWLKKLSNGLARTRKQFSSGLDKLFLGKKTIDAELFEKLETQLLLADVGIETTDYILQQLTERVKRKELNDPQSLIIQLKEILIEILAPHCKTLEPKGSPFVILMIGVNGAGKTTSIAKIAQYYKQRGQSIMLAAGDTFRAAAIEQLQVWGERNDVPVIAQQHGGDSAAIIFDALQSAIAKNIDILIADTAGRLHTQDHLMDELAKIKRVIQKINPDAPHEIMLVLDATMGQNALQQAKEFNEEIGLSSITLTKLDGTAKGGIAFAIANQLQLPYRFIGVGEGIDDLKPFTADDFVNALFEE
jgi:fused signal recognition particle receptor